MNESCILWLPWESKTMQNSALFLFPKSPLCFSLQDDIFIYYWLKYFKNYENNVKIASNFFFYISIVTITGNKFQLNRLIPQSNQAQKVKLCFYSNYSFDKLWIAKVLFRDSIKNSTLHLICNLNFKSHFLYFYPDSAYLWFKGLQNLLKF